MSEYEFQNDCVDYLVDKTADANSKNTIKLKAPTGAGKTIILVKYIDEYLKNTNDKIAFIWLCPGRGDLEMQSKERMDEMTPQRDTRTLEYSMMLGFDPGSVTFINWERVTKKNNKALQIGEKASLYEMVEAAHKNGTKFVIIIDEEHQNDTTAADEIIKEFNAKNIIRVSATAREVAYCEFYEISEDDVIEAGLITRAIYVNEGVDDKKEYSDEADYDYLIELADKKRKQILKAYRNIGSNIRPLVLIQFPSGDRENIKRAEEKLERMGYTYDNGMVAIWMADDKKNLDGITRSDGKQAFLLMKQAVSTGWDCPRAKILVKLREGGNQEFQIQTIGRIRRMPERKHYGIEVLDYCYIYTLDKTYKEGMISDLDKAYQVRKLLLKEEPKKLRLEKELRNLDFDGLGERETLLKVYEYFKDTYHLGKDKEINKQNLEAGGYNFSHTIDSRITQGEYRTTERLAEAALRNNITIQTKVNTHTHGIYLLHSVDEIKKVTGIKSKKMKNILMRLFKKGGNSKYKFTALENLDFYAFVINNVRQLKIDFRKVTAQMGGVQLSFMVEPKKAEFKIPEVEIYKYVEAKESQVMRLNAYRNYTDEFITDKTRSRSERLFEKYCEKSGDVEWVYKNGDTGQQYLSIVYLDGLLKQWLFYPDYIVHMKDGTDWIIETKGGESAGHSNNIDIQVANKFIAFKQYAEKHNLKWGFVRDKDDKLYINNTEYHEEMSDDSWELLSNQFKADPTNQYQIR